MTPSKCFGLAILTVIAIALAIMTSWTARDGGAISDRGQAFLPGLLEQANAVAQIKVQEKDLTTEVTKQGDQFLDASGYPISTDVVRNLISSLALLTKEGKKTADPSRFGALKLGSPEAKEGAGTLIELKDESGRDISKVISGQRENSVGGTGGGQYIRSIGSGPSYLVRGSVKLPTVRKDWFDRTLLKTEISSLADGSLLDGERVVYRVALENDKHVVKDIPAGRVLDEIKVNRVIGMFGTLRFADVRAETKGQAAKGAVLKMETAEGLEVSVQGLKALSENGEWFRVTAKANKDSAKTALEALEKKIKGFEFKLIPSEVELFGWTVQDLTTKSES